jgi:hypothetical protein
MPGSLEGLFETEWWVTMRLWPVSLEVNVKVRFTKRMVPLLKLSYKVSYKSNGETVLSDQGH